MRYAKGFEPPIGVLKKLSDKSGVSMLWLCDGVMATPEDAKMEIAAIEKELNQVNRSLAGEKEADRLALADRQGEMITELERLTVVRDELKARKRAPTTLGVRSLLDYYNWDSGSDTANTASTEIDLALLEDLMVALDEVLHELNRRVTPEAKAKLIGQVYAKAIEAHQAGRAPAVTADIIKLVRRAE